MKISDKTPFILLLLSLFLLPLQECGLVNNVRLESEPPNAKVYMISLLDWEKDSTIVSDPNKLKKYRVVQGNTPVETQAYEKTYVVIFELNGKKEQLMLDVIQGKKNYAKAVLE